MSDKTAKTLEDDAPLSAAKKPDIAGADLPHIDADALIGRTVTINRPRGELFAFWRDFQNLSRFMENVETVTNDGDGLTHWVVSAPAGRKVEWYSRIVEEEPDSLIGWKSVDGADVMNAGRIEFRDSRNGRGTEVTATIAYDAPGGDVGRLVAKLFQKEPKIQARRDLRRFKQLMETGEVSTAKPPHAAPRAE
jgi:uncharacterized membrane protein